MSAIGNASARPPRSLAQWLAYQHTLNPELIDLGLDRLVPIVSRLALSRGLGTVITVAGTNGKGSTVAMLEALAVAHGWRVGSYTSPHLLRYNECVRVDGVPTRDEAIVASFEQIEAARGDVPLTAFEFRTLAALQQLQRAAPRCCVLEVGLGGRLDAVNVVDADVAVITALGLDHQQWLGPTLNDVAREKCGIVRSGRPAVSADPETAALIAAPVAAAGARLVAPGHGLALTERSDGTWCVEVEGRSLGPFERPGLAGGHQLQNAVAAVTALTLAVGADALSAARVSNALVRVQIGARLERIGGDPERWVDVAHNAHATRALAKWMLERGRGFRAVCAMYEDKDASAALAPLIDVVTHWYVAPLPPPRGGSAERLRDALAALGGERACVEICPDVASAWRRASSVVSANEALIGLGSFDTVRAILRLESQHV